MDAAIEIRGLSKAFGSTQALDSLDLTVATGEVHGFLGPNGSGKSTTIRVLLGLLSADAGAVSLLGGDPWRDATTLHRRLAYVPGDVSLWPSLSGGEVIDLMGRLRGGLDQRRRAELLERFELDPTKKGRTYSKGNKQKVAIVAALASQVELLILDEPSSGLDPLMESVFQQVIAEEKDRGRTVLLSSHILSEVEALCDRVSIVRAGHVVEAGSLAQMRHLTRTSLTAVLDAAPPGLTDRADVHDLVVTASPGGPVTVRADVDTVSLGQVLTVLAGAGLQSLTSQPPTLEELFLRHYSATPRP
ncbi:ABC-2 type transport system ATP-binding protein [Sanguibacter gelidistatuariae]|uniref:ABC-2 type transport system ATP-binding protein n=1 Tax=Sanguibacter gelidistatuariae TaxID=1814289 RepID=A0A1G6H6K7_9MICO|nr:ABC transporter ATP-binding protein [Sanguibacter gelidistatuariae]SDB89909.1 ABC-2 type transport system ATP-binding protein [Sanguibacter gelidistatuariae]